MDQSSSRSIVRHRRCLPQLPPEIWTEILKKTYSNRRRNADHLHNLFQYFALRNVSHLWRVLADTSFVPVFFHFQTAVGRYSWDAVGEKIFNRLLSLGKNEPFLDDLWKLATKERKERACLFLIRNHPELVNQEDLSKLEPLIGLHSSDLVRVFLTYSRERFEAERPIWRDWFNYHLSRDSLSLILNSNECETLFELGLLDLTSIGCPKSMVLVNCLVSSYKGPFTRSVLEKILRKLCTASYVFDELEKFLREPRIKALASSVRVDVVPIFKYFASTNTFYQDFYKRWNVLLEAFPQADLTQDQTFFNLALKDSNIFDLLVAKNKSFSCHPRTLNHLEEKAKSYLALKESIENSRDSNSNSTVTNSSKKRLRT